MAMLEDRLSDPIQFVPKALKTQLRISFPIANKPTCSTISTENLRRGVKLFPPAHVHLTSCISRNKKDRGPHVMLLWGFPRHILSPPPIHTIPSLNLDLQWNGTFLSRVPIKMQTHSLWATYPHGNWIPCDCLISISPFKLQAPLRGVPHLSNSPPRALYPAWCLAHSVGSISTYSMYEQKPYCLLLF